MKREINYDTEHCNRHLMLKDALIPSDVTCFVISQSMSSLRMLNGVARILSPRSLSALKWAQRYLYNFYSSIIISIIYKCPLQTNKFVPSSAAFGGVSRFVTEISTIALARHVIYSFNARRFNGKLYYTFDLHLKNVSIARQTVQRSW